MTTPVGKNMTYSVLASAFGSRPAARASDRSLCISVSESTVEEAAIRAARCLFLALSRCVLTAFAHGPPKHCSRHCVQSPVGGGGGGGGFEPDNDSSNDPRYEPGARTKPFVLYSPSSVKMSLPPIHFKKPSICACNAYAPPESSSKKTLTTFASSINGPPP